jgi:hypothetical protein
LLKVGKPLTAKRFSHSWDAGGTSSTPRGARVVLQV